MNEIAAAAVEMGSLNHFKIREKCEELGLRDVIGILVRNDIRNPIA